MGVMDTGDVEEGHSQITLEGAGFTGGEFTAQQQVLLEHRQRALHERSFSPGCDLPTLTAIPVAAHFLGLGDSPGQSRAEVWPLCTGTTLS